MWKAIEGYKYIYRVNDQGEVNRQLPNGHWRRIKPYDFGGGQMKVWMILPDDKRVKVEVSKLVVDAFMGGTPPGMMRAHRNGLKSDNAVENIIFRTRAEVAKRHRPGNSRPVLKLDRAGNVVDIYPSSNAAARANYTSQAQMSKMCRGEVKDPYKMDGYRYTYEEKRGRKKKYAEA
jgi:hypothetical protein